MTVSITEPLPMPLGGWDPLGVRPRFGTYRGLVRLALGHLDHMSGRLRDFERVDWDAVDRLVFVCFGNVCRSPYAERRAAVAGLPVASFGLSTTTGVPAFGQARLSAAARGIDLERHRACDANDFEIRRGDLRLAMEPRQNWIMRKRFTEAPGQRSLLGLWSRRRRPHIHDPYRLSAAYFDNCFVVIDSAVAVIAERLGTRQAPNG